MHLYPLVNPGSNGLECSYCKIYAIAFLMSGTEETMGLQFGTSELQASRY